MDIHGFAVALASRVERQVPRAHLKNEGEFERNHVVEPAWELSEKHPEIRVFVHPRREERSAGAVVMRVLPILHAGSKVVPTVGKPARNGLSWMPLGLGTTSIWSHLTVSKKTLAVEVKWLSFLGGKGPNSEFQRFIGQCALAAAVHDVVIGVCGFRGRRKEAVRQTRCRPPSSTKEDRRSLDSRVREGGAEGEEE